MVRQAHCWTGYYEWLEEIYGFDAYIEARCENWPDATCLLWEGHDGPHVWTRDDEIVIRFADDAAGDGG